MNYRLLHALSVKLRLLLVLSSAPALLNARAQLTDGESAPDFTIIDSTGHTQRLSSYPDKYVVLEWMNIECPLVRKHYESRNMPKLQKQLAAKGVIWFSVISSAKGRKGYCTPEQANAFIKETGSTPTAILLDVDGTVGRLYGAKTTPQLFVIDRHGKVRYQGALDSDNSVDPATIPDAENYLLAAFADLFANRPASKPVTKSYGCTVKYE